MGVGTSTPLQVRIRNTFAVSTCIVLPNAFYLFTLRYFTSLSPTFAHLILLLLSSGGFSSGRYVRTDTFFCSSVPYSLSFLLLVSYLHSYRVNINLQAWYNYKTREGLKYSPSY